MVKASTSRCVYVAVERCASRDLHLDTRNALQLRAHAGDEALHFVAEIDESQFEAETGLHLDVEQGAVGVAADAYARSTTTCPPTDNPARFFTVMVRPASQLLTHLRLNTASLLARSYISPL